MRTRRKPRQPTGDGGENPEFAAARRIATSLPPSAPPSADAIDSTFARCGSAAKTPPGRAPASLGSCLFETVLPLRVCATAADTGPMPAALSLRFILTIPRRSASVGVYWSTALQAAAAARERAYRRQTAALTARCGFRGPSANANLRFEGREWHFRPADRGLNYLAHQPTRTAFGLDSSRVAERQFDETSPRRRL